MAGVPLQAFAAHAELVAHEFVAELEGFQSVGRYGAVAQSDHRASQDELEAILRGAVVGLRDGTISTDGLETFKLGYEFVRDELSMRRESLKRHAGHEDNVVIVKSAQSA